MLRLQSLSWSCLRVSQRGALAATRGLLGEASRSAELPKEPSTKGTPEASNPATKAPRGEVDIANGVPHLQPGRKAFISAPARTATQQGNVMAAFSGAPVWRIELESSTDKWINPLIGWTATGDPWESVNRSNLVFQTKQAAIAFADKLGLEYEVLEPNPRYLHQRPKRYQGYGDNFSTKRKGIPVGGLSSEQQQGDEKK